MIETLHKCPHSGASLALGKAHDSIEERRIERHKFAGIPVSDEKFYKSRFAGYRFKSLYERITRRYASESLDSFERIEKRAFILSSLIEGFRYFNDVELQKRRE